MDTLDTLNEAIKERYGRVADSLPRASPDVRRIAN